MSSNDPGQLRHFQALYLSLNGADIWFIIGDERIPSHKLILTATIPYYKTIYPEDNDNGEIHLTGVSVESFKEFLKFVYLVQPNLSMDNIEGVMDMARRWDSDEIFMECEQFLQGSLIDTLTLFFGYRLASTYGAKRLKKLFQNEICAKATDAFKTASFLTLPQEFLVKILECNRLACKEIDIFNACIAWAIAACIRNGLDSSNENLRSQLGDSLYQIRFTSMTNEEAATCTGSHPKLFTAIELHEILCMVGHRKQFKPKKFNWTIRYFDLNVKSNLNCSRFRNSDDCKSTYNVQTVEVTKFTCDRNIVLNGIELEMNQNTEESIHIRIDEKNQDYFSNECYSERSVVQFAGKQLTTQSEQRNATHLNSFVAQIPLNRSLLLRANYTYTISITFNNSNSNSNLNLLSRRTLKEKVRVDCDTVFWFSKRGIVSSLMFRRFDDRTIFRKIIHSPKFWVQVMAMILLLCFGAAFYISPTLRANIFKTLPIVWPYIQCFLYIFFGLLVIFIYYDVIGIATSSSLNFLFDNIPQLQVLRNSFFYFTLSVVVSLYLIYYFLGVWIAFVIIFVFFFILIVAFKIGHRQP